ncbi:hypothetical protein KC19_4G212500 [Ceratodon purpureus]|uniref:Uncharacterized protein n=1 Tax=Ceratodon purpureus TaxID=3225 RepID=A0A8T0IDF8_CERPU|nr:hypothetical protein KC19_4G212500 [Ceratodon purpureus]
MHVRMFSLIKIRPSCVMSTLAQVTARSAAILVVLVMLLDYPQTTMAQPSFGYDTTPPPPYVLTPPASAPPQNLYPSPPPPILATPPASQNPTPSLPPPVPTPLTTTTPPEKWNGSYPPSDFREDIVPSQFILWPENLPYVKFMYFCQQVWKLPKRNLTDFSYNGGDARLQTRPYFDLGLVDIHNRPYLRRWFIDWRVDVNRLVCPVVCEYTDIQRLYQYRLHRDVLLTGFAYGVIIVAILQLGTAVSIILLWVLNLNKIRHKVGETGKPDLNQSLIAFLRNWCNHPAFWLNIVRDWVHLVLLVIVGFSMMEAAGHSNFFEWRSMLFYNFGVTYSWLTLLAVVSSILPQCAQSLTSQKLKPVPEQATDLPLNKASSKNLAKKASTKKSGPLLTTDVPTAASLSENLVQALWGSDDWKYQRIFGQFGVLILMSMYLLSVDDSDGKSMDSLASVIFGAIVVACIWSFVVATIIAIRSLRFIFNTSCTKKSVSEDSEVEMC